ncbi:dienelactone hydrolase family protein [Piscinibacter koreensis]|uniref:Dienelactone hydrolase family protein n=1 Tax=Piscinibacter koreensis TaxID=2742824 RepID=A0A7Y6TWV7_9BURK|nr:dienelactone hydrolase family protein [Schlegelella koreensis]NUZ06468.1 dienelactone hydrolase family protein [Schlegelella koreensis]
MSPSNETVSLQASDGHRFSAYVARPASAPRGAIVVLQEIFGVNSHIRSVTDGFAADGWLAIAPALFDRTERDVQLGYTADDVARGRTLKGAVDDEQVLLDIAAAQAHVADAGPVATIGYCWGGTMSWLAAARLPGLAAAVAYYGSGIAGLLDEAPRCPVLAHFGDKDSSIPPSAIDALRKAHPQVEVHVYPADHGFNCDQRASFDAASARTARERTLAFLGAHASKR